MSLLETAIAKLRDDRAHRLTAPEIATLIERLNVAAPTITIDVDQHLAVDTRTRTVTLDGQRVEGITNKMYDVLALLAKDPQRVWTNEEIQLHCWNITPEMHVVSRSCQSHISKLRRTLGHGYVENVWGVGYRLLPQDGTPGEGEPRAGTSAPVPEPHTRTVQAPSPSPGAPAIERDAA